MDKVLSSHPHTLRPTPAHHPSALSCSHLLKSSPFEQVSGNSSKSKKEGQGNQITIKWLGGGPQLFYLSLLVLAFCLALHWAPWNFLKGASFKEKRVVLTPTCIEPFLVLKQDHAVSYRHASVKPPWTFMLTCMAFQRTKNAGLSDVSSERRSCRWLNVLRLSFTSHATNLTVQLQLLMPLFMAL